MDNIRFVLAIPTATFATQKVPLGVLAIHALAMALVYRPMVDPPTRTPPRSPLGSLCLTLFGLLSGGTVTSLLLCTTPGWVATDRVLLVYTLAWLAVRSDRLFAALCPLRPLLLLFHNAFFRPLVLVSGIAAASAALPRSVFGPVALIITTMHGCTWLAQLLLAALEGRASMFTFCADADFVRPSMGLRTTFWVALVYRLVLLLSPSPAMIAAAHLFVVAACVADCVIHDLLSLDTSIFSPLESVLSALVELPTRFGVAAATAEVKDTKKLQ